MNNLEIAGAYASIAGFVWPLILGVIGFRWGRRLRQAQLQRLARREVPRLLANVQVVYGTMRLGPSEVGGAFLASLAGDAHYLAQVHSRPKVVKSHLHDLHGTLEDATGFYYEWQQLPNELIPMNSLREKLRSAAHLLETLDLELVFTEEV